MLDVLRGCRDLRDGCGKTLSLIADGNPPATEDAGAEHRGRERPGTPQGVLAPKNGDKRGRSRPRCGFSRVGVVLGFSLGVLALQ